MGNFIEAVEDGPDAAAIPENQKCKKCRPYRLRWVETTGRLHREPVTTSPVGDPFFTAMQINVTQGGQWDEAHGYRFPLGPQARVYLSPTQNDLFLWEPLFLLHEGCGPGSLPDRLILPSEVLRFILALARRAHAVCSFCLNRRSLVRLPCGHRIARAGSHPPRLTRADRPAGMCPDCLKREIGRQVALHPRYIETHGVACPMCMIRFPVQWLLRAAQQPDCCEDADEYYHPPPMHPLTPEEGQLLARWTTFVPPVDAPPRQRRAES